MNVFIKEKRVDRTDSSREEMGDPEGSQGPSCHQPTIQSQSRNHEPPANTDMSKMMHLYNIILLFVVLSCE